MATEKAKRNIAEVSLSSDDSTNSPLHKSRALDEVIGHEMVNNKDIVDWKSVIDRLVKLEKNNNRMSRDLELLKISEIELIQNNKGLEKKVEELEFKVEELEQHGRRVNVRFFGVHESDRETTDDVVRRTCKQVLNVDVAPNEISRSHRLGQAREGKPRPIICRLLSHKVKRRIIEGAKACRVQTKKAKIFIAEDLTKPRAVIVTKARNLVHTREILSVWTEDGAIKVRKNDTSICTVRVRSPQDLEDCKQPPRPQDHRQRNHLENENLPPPLPRMENFHSANLNLPPQSESTPLPGASGSYSEVVTGQQTRRPTQRQEKFGKDLSEWNFQNIHKKKNLNKIRSSSVGPSNRRPRTSTPALSRNDGSYLMDATNKSHGQDG